MTVTPSHSLPVPDPGPSAPSCPTARPRLPRWQLILAWSLGPAAAYALLSLAHAGLVERVLSVDVGFGRSLAFWVLSAYLALGLWGFLPREPHGRWARPPPAYGALAVGALGLVVCGGFTLGWLTTRWNTGVAVPVLAALAVMIAAAVATLWVADRTEAD